MKRTRKAAESSKVNLVHKAEEALLNDVVLQNIFKYLTYKDLKSVRAVKNCIWLRNSNNAWWTRTKVVLNEEKDKVSKNLDNYLKQTEIITRAKNYKFENFIRSDYKGFWEDLGHSIKYLELDFCKFSSVDEFRQIIYTKCPNVEKLVVDLVSINGYPVAIEPMEWQEPQFGQQKNLKFLKLHFNGSIMPLSWMEMLSHFPNLEALEVQTDEDIYRVISIIRQHDPKMLKLKHIDIRGLYATDNRENLRLVLLDQKLSFETIRIALQCERETLLDILELHAKSLKELCLFGDCGRSPIKLPLRKVLHNLEKFTLISCLFTEDVFRFTPNVREIHLNYDGAYNLLKSADSNLRIDTCKKITLNIVGKWKDSNNSDLAFFLNAFPNVEILETSGLNNLKFSMICEKWTKLVSFTSFYDNEVDVFGLLGYNPDLKTKIGRKPNITNLKDLRVFSMGARKTRKQQGARGPKRMEMKNGDVVLKKLKSLPQLRTFELNEYKLENKVLWEKIFAKYPANKSKGNEYWSEFM